MTFMYVSCPSCRRFQILMPQAGVRMPWLNLNKLELLKQDMELQKEGSETCPECIAKKVPVFPIPFPVGASEDY